MLKKKIRSAAGFSLHGSATIEAYVVVPVAMVIMLAVIYLSYYVHDKSCMTAVNYYAVLEHADGTGTSKDLIPDIQNYISGKLIWASDVNAHISTGNGRSGAESSASFNLPFELVRKMLPAGMSSMYSEINITGLGPRKKLLLYKCICDGVKKIKSAWGGD